MTGGGSSSTATDEPASIIQADDKTELPPSSTTTMTTTTTTTMNHHHHSTCLISDLNELTVLGIEHVQGVGTPTISTEDPNKVLPKTTLMVIAGNEVLNTTSATATTTATTTSTTTKNSSTCGEENNNGDDRPTTTTVTTVATAGSCGTTTTHRPQPRTTTTTTPSLMSSFNEVDFATFDTTNIIVTHWDLTKKYSDYILDGISYLREKNQNQKNQNTITITTNQNDDDDDDDDDPTPSKVHDGHVNANETIKYDDDDDDETRLSTNIVMLFESPSTSTTNASFTNTKQYRFHDWPPLKSTRTKGILGPGRYASMNGNALPVFLREDPPIGLLDHWNKYIPGFVPPTFVSSIQPDQTVYAYLPVECLDRHVNDPSVHYHLAGKDAIHLMTQKTTRLLSDTKTVRPCVVKTTHSMGSKGIFIITDDEDEMAFEHFYEAAGHPTFVITDFVDIHRNVACHFFIHPNGSIVWFGSNENHRLDDGKFSSDSYLLIQDQAELQRMQMPFVEEVVTYCQSLQFWGFCGIDVLFDSRGKGYLVDINPRVTGSCPALMTLSLLNNKYHYTVGLFRRTGDTTYHGSAAELLAKVDAHNAQHGASAASDNGTTTSSRLSTHIILHSFLELSPSVTRINIGVYGNDLNECKRLLHEYAQPAELTPATTTTTTTTTATVIPTSTTETKTIVS